MAPVLMRFSSSRPRTVRSLAGTRTFLHDPAGWLDDGRPQGRQLGRCGLQGPGTGEHRSGLVRAQLRLYATNFHAGTVDVFDSTFHQVTLASGAFTDPQIPQGIRPVRDPGLHIAGHLAEFLFVTYAKQDADKHDDVAGRGHGFVDVFDTSGNLIQRVASRGTLNSPWGIALAPSNFGKTVATS